MIFHVPSGISVSVGVGITVGVHGVVGVGEGDGVGVGELFGWPPLEEQGPKIGGSQNLDQNPDEKGLGFV